MTTRIAVLASGRGSNLQAILDAIADGRLDAAVVGVFSDKPDALALQRVPAGLRWARMPRDYGDRHAFDAALADAVAASTPDWVICAGYMRILGVAFVERFRGRILNIHPSLLPRHRGLHTHARALEAGDAEHGASIRTPHNAIACAQSSSSHPLRSSGAGPGSRRRSPNDRINPRSSSVTDGATLHLRTSDSSRSG